MGVAMTGELLHLNMGLVCVLWTEDGWRECGRESIDIDDVESRSGTREASLAQLMSATSFKMFRGGSATRIPEESYHSSRKTPPLAKESVL